MKKICITGHRPKSLYGYDLSDPRWIRLKMELKNYLQQFILEQDTVDAITGMALGVDTIFAQAVLELQEEGFPISLIAMIPCLNQERMWRAADKNRYKEILSKADKVIYTSNEEYRKSLMILRNHAMVDEADQVLAVWRGINGGTASTIDYAKKRGKPLTILDPRVINEGQRHPVSSGASNERQ